MRIPKALRDELSAPGVEAWKAGAGALGDRAESFADAIARYARAVDRVARLREEWIADGRPLTTEGGATGRAIVEHPLLSAIDKAEKTAAQFGKAIGLEPGAGRSPGRPKGASSAPDRDRAAQAEGRPGLRRVQ